MGGEYADLFSASSQIAVVLALTLVLEARADANRARRNSMSLAYRVSVSVWWLLLATAILIAFSISVAVLSGGAEANELLAVIVTAALSISFGGCVLGIVLGVVVAGYFGKNHEVP